LVDGYEFSGRNSCIHLYLFYPEDGGSMLLETLAVSTRLHSITFLKRVVFMLAILRVQVPCTRKLKKMHYLS
jgi:hypothetical protein